MTLMAVPHVGRLKTWMRLTMKLPAVLTFAFISASVLPAVAPNSD